MRFYGFPDVYYLTVITQTKDCGYSSLTIIISTDETLIFRKKKISCIDRRV